MVDWKSSTALITGGAQGIGLGIARALARQGVRLALVDVDVAALQAAAAELGDLTDVETHELDVRDRERFAEVADKVERALGPVNLLFNNAGVVPIIHTSKMTYADWDWALGVNLGGVVNGVQTFVPRMVERGQGGHIVNTASGAGLVATPGAFYGTAKFAVVGMSETLRIDLDGVGIKVSVLCPGRVDTEIVANTLDRREVGGWTDQTRAAAASATISLRTGVTIDSVGERVVAGLERDATWIHTDDELRPLLEARFGALLASL
jgi:NAD(P)-dependent dehydrogenase (short-subunit alcohol dehydrogenase family)